MVKLFYNESNLTYGKRVTAALRNNKYDYVVFQELTTLAVTDHAQTSTATVPILYWTYCVSCITL